MVSQLAGKFVAVSRRRISRQIVNNRLAETGLYAWCPVWRNPLTASSNKDRCGVKGILGKGGVMDKCDQMWNKELWRLGTDDSGEGERKKSGENGRKEKGEETEGGETRGEDRRDGERKGLSPEIGEKKTMNAGGVENGI
ncbi:hypothetical protein TNCV_3577901 [Trichonephila clavipes]|uniref:Uncharacterized protein n=1 Tax=Trichonephila clavipes TaxID=2585209 RepID=A0A8X6RDA0_TRICX|nr:hypothetical protein TNCV_3577901 [Trichonephila clavipes]